MFRTTKDLAEDVSGVYGAPALRTAVKPRGAEPGAPALVQGSVVRVSIRAWVPAGAAPLPSLPSALHRTFSIAGSGRLGLELFNTL